MNAMQLRHLAADVARRIDEREPMRAELCRLIALAGFALTLSPVEVLALDRVGGKVISVRSETGAACADCQMRVELDAPIGGARRGDNVLMVVDRAHDIPPGSRVVVEALPEREGDSGAFIRVRVVEVRR
jgi:DNA helicase HerA-like ATPase